MASDLVTVSVRRDGDDVVVLVVAGVIDLQTAAPSRTVLGPLGRTMMTGP